MVEVPGNIGRPPSISPRMPPIDHTSTPFVYLRTPSATKATLCKRIGEGKGGSVRGLRCRAEQDFGCAVPARCDVVGEHLLHALFLLFLQRSDGARQTEVCHLDHAVRVQQYVARLRGGEKEGHRSNERERDPDLQVAVQNVCGMNVLHRLQKLIQNVALMYILQNVRVDNRMKVSLWEVSAVFFSFFFETVRLAWSLTYKNKERKTSL